MYTITDRTREYIDQQRIDVRRRRRASLLLGCAGVAFACIVGWIGIQRWHARQQDQRVAELVARQDRSAAFQAVESGQVSAERLFTAFIDARVAAMEKRLDEYFALPESQRVVYLDKMIDERESQRGGTGPPREGSATRPTTAPTTRRADDRDRGPPQPQRSQMRQRVQMRMDNTSPQRRAQFAEFQAAMQKRRAERGLPERRGWR
jgi:hypothetical protein